VTTALGDVSRAVDPAGVFASAVLGGAVARALRMDPIGFGSLALVSGLGGGLIRDTPLQNGPPAALTDSRYVLTAVAGAAVAFMVPMHTRLWALSYPLVDALALGTWAAVGAQKTLGIGLGWLAAVLLGTMSAVGGGVLRDLTVGRMPQIFGGNTLYANLRGGCERGRGGVQCSRVSLGGFGGCRGRRCRTVSAGPLAWLATRPGLGVGLRSAPAARQTASRNHRTDAPLR
jgi:uncharacterized membrane protein YeiH